MPIAFESSAHGRPTVANERNMKKTNPKRKKPSLPEYDFSNGIRGKYAARYAEGTNVVVLSPDVAEVFPDAQAVNEALRTLVRISGKSASARASRVKRNS